MSHWTRRQLLQGASAGAVALALRPLNVFAQPAAKGAKGSGFTVPPLPYAYDALQPYIDKQTMEIHHDKHHQTYVTNLNKALEGHPDLLEKSVVELLRSIKSLPEKVQTAVRNQGGGHSNHTIFWRIMGPRGAGKPSGELGQAIDQSFGNFEKFQKEFSDAATTLFGSGWAWLVLDRGGKLQIVQRHNQDSPFMDGLSPILGLDVWEHAYYLKYQNRRPEYVAAWWHVVNWQAAGERYARGHKG